MIDCPCCSGKPYAECCEPFHLGRAHAPTAEALMRSRYSAFAKHEVGYLVTTVHPDARHDMDEDQIRNWSERSEWLNLQIVSTERGGPDDNDGTVEFIARYKDSGQVQVYHEIGSFRREDDRWYFVDGERPKKKPVVRETPKVGRNDPCTCGSGKKYKKCCGKK
ncbi:MAG: YchJ family protein [Acidobacteriota bacterium]|nr:YchJ family protein [Acidobacteriota bacterium]